MKKSHVGWQTLVVILLATVYVAAPGLSLAGTAKGVRLSPKVADPQTDFLAVQVGSDGTFNMGANPLVADCGTGPTFDTPCRYNLMFSWPAEPGSSFTTVRIDGSDFIYGSALFGPGTFLPTVVPPTDTDPFTNLSAVEFFGTTGPVRVTQELKIVRGLTGNRDTARIRYVATNLDSVSHNVGLRIMLDTMLNDNDGAPFRVNGAPITTETDYVGAAVPSFFDVFFDLNVPGISARGTLRDGVVTPPDRFVIAAWPNISGTRFNFTVEPTRLVTNDSAIGIYWNPVSLGPGESRVFETFYGVSGAVGGGGLLVTAPGVLGIAPDLTAGAPAGAVVWSPNPFQVDAFFTPEPGTSGNLTLDLSTAASQLTSLSPTSVPFSSVGGETVHAQWQVRANAPGEAHYRVRVTNTSVLAEQEVVTRVPELVVPPVDNPRNQGPFPLVADGRFCIEQGEGRNDCVADFVGNVGGVPSVPFFEWQGITPTGFKAGPAGAVPVLLNDPELDTLVYAALDTTAIVALDLYLMYDFLHRTTPFGAGENPTVEFEIKFGRFQTPPGSRMVVTFLCDQHTVVVGGFDNGVAFSGRPGDQLGIEGDCGFGPSPNPSGDPSFDVRFNADHARFELEVPLTRNLGGGDRLDGVYDPSPAFWTALAPGSGTLVLSQNTLSIDINTGGTTVTPLQPQAQTSPLVLKKGEMRLERDRDEDEDKDEREDRLSLRGSFVVPPDSINPPAEGVTVTLVDGDGQIAEIRIPSGQGWKTSRGPEWVFKDKKNRSLADPLAREQMSIKFNRERGRFDVRVNVKDTELTDPDAGPITTTLTIGDQTFVNTQAWRSKDRGRKLVTP